MIVIDLDSWVWHYIAIIQRFFYRERKLEALNYYLNIYIYQSLQAYWIMQFMMFSQNKTEKPFSLQDDSKTDKTDMN